MKNWEIEIRPGLEIVTLFLEKLEKLSEKEREVLIETINLINHPLIVTGEENGK